MKRQYSPAENLLYGSAVALWLSIVPMIFLAIWSDGRWGFTAIAAFFIGLAAAGFASKLEGRP